MLSRPSSASSTNPLSLLVNLSRALHLPRAAPPPQPYKRQPIYAEGVERKRRPRLLKSPGLKRARGVFPLRANYPGVSDLFILFSRPAGLPSRAPRKNKMGRPDAYSPRLTLDSFFFFVFWWWREESFGGAGFFSRFIVCVYLYT